MPNGRNAAKLQQAAARAAFRTPFDPFAAAQRAAAPFVGPGGGVAPGLRQPFGSYRQWAEPQDQDFLFRATRFRREWGEPPALPGLKWNPERWVYEPVLGYIPDRHTTRRNKFVPQHEAYSHFRSLAGRDLYVQPYRVSADTALHPWRQWALRLVHVPEATPSLQKPYTVTELHPREFMWKPPPQPDRADPDFEGLTPEEAQELYLQKMDERAAEIDKLGWLPAGKVRLPSGSVMRRYGPGDWMPDARMILSWEDYLRDPTLGGLVVPRLGVNLTQHPEIVKQMIEAAGGPKPRPAMEPHPVGETREEREARHARGEAARSGKAPETRTLDDVQDEYWADVEKWREDLEEHAAEQDRLWSRANSEQAEALEEILRKEQQKADADGLESQAADFKKTADSVRQRRLLRDRREAEKAAAAIAATRAQMERARRAPSARRASAEDYWDEIGAQLGENEAWLARERELSAQARRERDDAHERKLKETADALSRAGDQSGAAEAKAQFKSFVIERQKRELVRQTREITRQQEARRAATRRPRRRGTIGFGFMRDTGRRTSITTYPDEDRRRIYYALAGKNEWEREMRLREAGIRLGQAQGTKFGFMRDTGRRTSVTREARRPDRQRRRATRVPQVVGLSLKEAIAAFRNARVVLRNVRYVVDTSRQPGTVIQQSIPGREAVGEGEKVDLVVVSERAGRAPLERQPAVGPSGPPPAVVLGGGPVGDRGAGGAAGPRAPDDREVPNVVGLHVDEARRRLRRMGLIPVSAGSEEWKATGTVRSQNPGAGARLPVGSNVEIRGTVERPRGETSPAAPQPRDVLARVPRLAGLLQADAEASAQSAGFRTAVRGDTGPGARVLRQRPRSGDLKPKGSTINIWMGSAARSRLLEVPNLLGMSSVQARTRAEAAGFGMTIKNAAPNRAGPRVVLEQSPAPRARRRRGTVIHVRLSEPVTWGSTSVPTHPKRAKPESTQLVEVPDILGWDGPAAARLLRSLRLTPWAWGLAQQGVPMPGTTVTSQNPTHPLQVPVGTRVEFAVDSYLYEEDDVVVPNIRCTNVAAARTRLKELGLKLKDFPEYGTSIRDNLVTIQWPKPGRKVPKGTEVLARWASGSKASALEGALRHYAGARCAAARAREQGVRGAQLAEFTRRVAQAERVLFRNLHGEGRNWKTQFRGWEDLGFAKNIEVGEFRQVRDIPVKFGAQEWTLGVVVNKAYVSGRVPWQYEWPGKVGPDRKSLKFDSWGRVDAPMFEVDGPDAGQALKVHVKCGDGKMLAFDRKPPQAIGYLYGFKGSRKSGAPDFLALLRGRTGRDGRDVVTTYWRIEPFDLCTKKGLRVGRTKDDLSNTLVTKFDHTPSGDNAWWWIWDGTKTGEFKRHKPWTWFTDTSFDTGVNMAADAFSSSHSWRGRGRATHEVGKDEDHRRRRPSAYPAPAWPPLPK